MTMTRLRRSIARAGGFLAAVTASVGLLLVLPGPPAEAADGLQLSLDGQTWSANLGASVFPRGVSLVPGSSINGTFYVKNATASPAWVRVGVSHLVVTSADLALSMNMTTVGTTSDSASGATSRLNADDMVCTLSLIHI